MPIVEVCQLTCAYGARPVLDGVSFCLEPGDRVAVIGCNGAGKTTLLKVIAGLLPEVSGSVLIDGVARPSIPRRQLARLLALVPQDLVIPFAFTVQEIVELGRTSYLALFGDLHAADRRAVERAMAVTDTAALKDRVFSELSGGEQQRVLIAMALAQEPRILLLDEPTQRLDLTRQAEILDLIRSISDERGLTVLAAIHDLNLAAMYFDRWLVLSDRTVLADGAPRAIMRPELLERAYGGRLRFVDVQGFETPLVLATPKDWAPSHRTDQTPASTDGARDRQRGAEEP